MVAARGLIMSYETSEFAAGNLEQWHDISTFSQLSRGGGREGAYVHPIICLWGICPYMHILRGGQMSGGGAYVIHSLFTDNQLTDVTTNRQDKSPTVTILGKE